jgi:hypothetical protein
MRPRASVAVYLLRPFPSAAVRWPSTPLNVVRRLPVAPVSLCRRPLASNTVQFRAPPRLSCRLPVAPVSLCRRPLASNTVQFMRPRAQSPFTCCARFPLPPSVGLQRR